jgi:putative DNA primase/helicase
VSPLDVNRWREETPEEKSARLFTLKPVVAGVRNAIATRNPPNIGHIEEHSTPSSADGSQEVVLVAGTAIKMRAVCWLWDGFLAAGKLHMLAGAPGTGKTTLAINLAAIVTRGATWPDGSRCAEAGDVLIWSGEDDPADTLVPRLQAAGADMARVHFVDCVRDTHGTRTFDPAQDMPALELAAARAKVKFRLLIVDPVVSAVAGDSHKNAEVRRGLQPIVSFAQRFDVAAIGISHYSKGTTGKDPVERITGSVAFGALPRVVFGAARDMADQDGKRRVFVRAKCNIGPDGGGFAYELIGVEVAPGIRASTVRWLESLNGEARDILALAEPGNDPDEQSALDEAKEFLHSAIAFGGVARKQLELDAKGAGIAWRTVERAKKALGVAHRKEGMQGGFVWFMPANSANPPNLADFTNSANNAEPRQEIETQKVGGLREPWRTSGELAPAGADAEVFE